MTFASDSAIACRRMAPRYAVFSGTYTAPSRFAPNQPRIASRSFGIHERTCEPRTTPRLRSAAAARRARVCVSAKVQAEPSLNSRKLRCGRSRAQRSSKGPTTHSSLAGIPGCTVIASSNLPGAASYDFISGLTMQVSGESRRSRSELLADRQLTDALVGRRVDRVAQGRRDRRQSGLADAAERHRPVRRRQQVHSDVARCFRHARDLIRVEVVLLRATVLERDLAERGEAHAHDHRPFELRADAIGVHLRTAVERDVDARN